MREDDPGKTLQIPQEEILENLENIAIEEFQEEANKQPYNQPGFRPCTPTAANNYLSYRIDAEIAWTDLTVRDFDNLTTDFNNADLSDDEDLLAEYGYY